MALSFLAVVQLWSLWAGSSLPPLLFFTHLTWDYGLRFLFFLLVFAGRYYLFPEYRRPGVLKAAFATVFTGCAAFSLICRRPSAAGWFLAGLTLLDSAVLAVFSGVVIELAAAILAELWQKEKPFGYDLALPGPRFLAAEKGLATHLRLTLYFVPLFCLALYALHTRYLFPWAVSTRAAVLFLFFFFLLPLLRLQARLRAAAAPERQAVAEELIYLRSVYLRTRASSSASPLSLAGVCKEVIVLCLYDGFLLSSAALPWRWDHLLPLAGGFLVFFFLPAPAS